MRSWSATLLEGCWATGLSVAAIGGEVGLHESTVAYWMGRYGLRARGAEKHRGAGSASSESELEALVGRGLSIAQIAAEVDRSKATVRHWLRQYGLRTHGAPGVDRGEQLRCRATRRACSAPR